MNQQQNASKLKLIFRLIPVIGLLCILIGFGMAVRQARFSGPSYSIVGVGALLFLTLFIKAEVANLKYYLHVFIYSVLVLGICVVGYLFARQYTKKVDLTEQKFYSLSEMSTKYLKGLDKVVNITIFAPAPDPFREVMDLYKSVTEKVKWNVIDARTNPLEARKFGDAVRNGDIFIKSEAKTKKISVTELEENFENVLTNAIVEITRTKQLKLYFLAGHGEIAYEQTAQAGRRGEQAQASLGAFRAFLSQRAIETAQLDLGKTGNIPADASMVIIAGPKSDLMASEATALQSYLDKDGKLLALLDVPAQNFGVSMTNLTGLLKKYGIDAADKIILDLFSKQLGAQPVQPIAAWFDKEHPITKELGNRSTRFLLSLTRPVQATLDPVPGLQATELIKTSEKSWSEDLAKIAANERIRPPAQSEMKPQPLAVAVSKANTPPARPGMPAPPPAKGGMRMVVFGTSELIQDQVLAVNRTAVELMLNTVNWLGEQEDMIAVPPRQLKGTPIVLDPAQLRVIFFFAAVLIPAALFFGGVSYSMMRRRR